MTIETLPASTALVVVDLQRGTTSAQLAHPADEVIANAVRLVDAYRASGRPVVIATVTGTPSGRTTYSPGAQSFPAEFAAVVPQLVPGPDDIAVVRTSWSAFGGTALQQHLVDRGITDLVIVGVATSFGVESTARDAYDLGHSVVIATDAVTDRTVASHDHSFANVFPALGRVATTEEILTALQ